MEKTEFKKLLFKTAFCVMACDGNIDEKEIEEMRSIDTSTTYFSDIDLSDELDDLINNLKNPKTKVVKTLFKTLRENKLTLTQELLILEVTLRIIHADDKIEENEVRFLNLIRTKLELENEIIHDRFGKVPFLRQINYENVDAVQSDFIKDIKVPEIKKWKNIKL